MSDACISEGSGDCSATSFLAAPKGENAGIKESLMKLLEECEVSSDPLECTTDAFIEQDWKTMEQIIVLDKKMMKDILPKSTTGIFLNISKYMKGVGSSEPMAGSASLGESFAKPPSGISRHVSRHPKQHLIGKGSFGWTYLAHYVHRGSQEVSECALKVAGVCDGNTASHAFSEAIALSS